MTITRESLKAINADLGIEENVWGSLEQLFPV